MTISTWLIAFSWVGSNIATALISYARGSIRG